MRNGAEVPKAARNLGGTNVLKVLDVTVHVRGDGHKLVTPTSSLESGSAEQGAGSVAEEPLQQYTVIMVTWMPWGRSTRTTKSRPRARAFRPSRERHSSFWALAGALSVSVCLFYKAIGWAPVATVAAVQQPLQVRPNREKQTAAQ